MCTACHWRRLLRPLLRNPCTVDPAAIYKKLEWRWVKHQLFVLFLLHLLGRGWVTSVCVTLMHTHRLTHTHAHTSERVCVLTRTHGIQGEEKGPLDKVSFLFLPCGSQASNSGQQSWQQTPLPAGPLAHPNLKNDHNVEAVLPSVTTQGFL